MSYRRMTPARPMGSMYRNSQVTARVNSRINPRNWALAFVGAVLMMVEYRESEYRWSRAFRVVDVAANGRYVRLVRLLDGGTDWGTPKWHESRHYYRAYDTLDQFKGELRIRAMEQELAQLKEDQKRNAEQDLRVLSQNTVTRALVHASSNDYCSETAVALVSAGHKMPDLTLTFEVTQTVSIPIEGKHNYYVLRALFGATSGDVQGASGMQDYLDEYGNIHDAIREQLYENYSRYDTNIVHTDTDVTWHTPVLRQLSFSEANATITR